MKLVGLAKGLPVDLRFIELMPIGAGRELPSVPNAEILSMIERKYGKLEEDPENRGNGPAVYRRAEGFMGRIGFISAMHGKFCDKCNRLRMTSTGELKPCLCYADTVPLRDILRDREAGKEERVRAKILEAAERKPQAHCFEHRENVTEAKRMNEIGG